jgi:uncharacterized repeat protein (TIGR02543 family)
MRGIYNEKQSHVQCSEKEPRWFAVALTFAMLLSLLPLNLSFNAQASSSRSSVHAAAATNVITVNDTDNDAKCVADTNSYTITYNLNGGTLPPGAQNSYTTGTAYTLPIPSKTGYTFGGWYKTSDFTDTAVNGILATDWGSPTYYAKWVAITNNSNFITVNDTNNDGVLSHDEVENALGTDTAP